MNKDDIKINAKWKRQYEGMFYNSTKAFRTSKKGILFFRSQAKLIVQLFGYQMPD